MTRMLADLLDDDRRWLTARAAERATSRAAVLREAACSYRATAPSDWLDARSGAWEDRTDIGCAVEWPRRERAAWTRLWRDGDEVKAEFAELFDAQDDRQRPVCLEMLTGKYPTAFPKTPNYPRMR